MQNKKQNELVKKQTRRMHERVGAVILMAGTLAGIVGISHDARRALSQLALRPAFAIMDHTAKEGEADRIPVTFDNGLRSPSIGGN